MLRKFAAFRQEAAKHSQLAIHSDTSSGSDEVAAKLQTLKSLSAFEALLYAIRADLGHDVKGMKRGELMATFINDITGTPDTGTDK